MDVDFLTSNIFSLKASKILDYKKIDILVGWSSFSLEAFKNSEYYNFIKILERGSSHIEFQKNILKEEYDLLGLKSKLPSLKLINKEKEEYDLSDYICVPSEFAKKSFLKKGYEKKIIKIPYGVDLKYFNTTKKYKKKDEFNIISVGAISVRKGVIYLIKAFNELNLKNSKLTLIGDIEKGFKKTLLPLINDKIEIISSIKQNSLKEYYNCADVFVTCSIEEGLSMVQIQAMACGLPVISSENSGGEDIINEGEDGFILKIRDKDRLKEKLLLLYENKNLLALMSKKAELKAHTHFSWENYGNKVANFYLDILKKNEKLFLL